MYLVRQQGKIVETFTMFVDAWLYVYLECKSFALIIERNGDTWIINPAYDPGRPIN